MSSATRNASDFLTQLSAAAREADKHPSAKLIHVSELAALPSFVYEKIRNFVDYKDEYLLRKNALKRFFKRTLLMPHGRRDPSATALSLVRELILSRYLANDSVSEDTIARLAQVIAKYGELFEKVRTHGCKVPRWRQALLGLAAVECDTYLVSPATRNAYINFAYQLLSPMLVFPSEDADISGHNLQLVITIQRVLERADRDILSYYLLYHYVPDWFGAEPAVAAEHLAPAFASYLEQFNALLDSPLGRRLQPHVRRLLVPLTVFQRTLLASNQTVVELVNHEQTLNDRVAKAYAELWQTTKRSIRRKGFHAMTYIFITKITLAILIELPYERLVLGAISVLPLVINLAFPPLLMAIITLMVRSPRPENQPQVVAAVREMLYGGTPDFFRTRELKARSTSIWRRLRYGLLYMVTMLASLGLLVYVLRLLGFNPLSGALFIFFVSLVSFFGVNLRQQARQLRVVHERDSLFGFIIDFFTLPIVTVGKWLSTTFDRYNVFVFLLDFLFELPYKTLLKVIENWFHYLRDKREEEIY